MCGLNEIKKPFSPIVLVGGIHGSGKTSLINLIEHCVCNVHVLSASKILRWGKKEKNVSDIDENQKIIVERIRQETRQQGLYVIDGHFTLMNEEGEINAINVETFNAIKSTLFLLVESPIQEIHDRLILRDGISFDLSTLQNWQNYERVSAVDIAEKLNVPIYLISMSL